MDNTNYYRSNDLDGSSAGALQGTGDNSQSWTPATDGTYYYVDIRRINSTSYSVFLEPRGTATLSFGPFKALFAFKNMMGSLGMGAPASLA